MKYIITEDKVSQVIENYINNYYDLDNIHYTRKLDWDGNETDMIEYYLGDYDDEMFIFRLYEKSYWDDNNPYRKNLSPILFIEDMDFAYKLNRMFGKLWEPILKKWFEDNFGEEVKTIDYY